MVLLLLLCSTAGFSSVGAAPREPLKVVLWLGGFAHEFRSVGEILDEALPRHRPMKITIAWDGEFLDAAEPPDLILMYHCHQSTKDILTDAQKETLLKVVKEGVGVVALHASYYSFLEWDEYHKFYGARFIEHGKSEARLRVTPKQKQHPIFAGIDEPLEIVSELYRSTPVPEDCDVLAHSMEIDQGISQPSIWTRTYGKGRIVTILPGHFADNYRNAPFQRLIVNSMDWAVNKGIDTTTADREPVPIKPRYDWEEAAIDAFKLPDGFEISLVASEPHLANPISMALDEQGRIFVSNAHSYRQRWWLMDPAPEQEPTNPIVCLTPGPSGRAIEANIVAEGFEQPVMGLSVAGNRLWATNLNHLFVTALDKTGRMTGDRVTLVRDATTPWNPFGMYRVVRGPDDLLYLTVGDHATQLTGTAGKSAVRIDNNGSGAVFRFRDDGTELELLLEGMRAPFTLDFTPFGRLWVITNGEGSPNCLLDAVHGTDYRFRNGSRGEWSWLTGEEPLAAPVWENPPGAHTAVLPYYSSAFPQQYWGNLLVSNFGVHGEPATRNEVLRLILDERGRVLRREPFISSSDHRFRPTQVSLAPDGSLYMLDWYGKDDENDLTGRLYRITYTGKDVLPNEGTGLENRNHAQRARSKVALLAAGSAASLPVIDKALSGKDALAAAESLWTLRRSGWTSAPDHIRKALSHHDWRVRRLALQLLRGMNVQQDEELRKLLGDPDPAVQMEAALGFRNAAAHCTALVQAVGSGAAKVRRLRFMAALEIARYGQEEHFAALLTAADPDVQLAGLIALDEAFYDSSKGFKVPLAGAEQRLAELDQSIGLLRTRLESEDPQQLAARRKWEATMREKVTGTGWLPLRPKQTKRRAGADLKLLDDLSLLAAGDDPANDSYTATFENPLENCTGLRLEIFPDPSLTGGRYSRGNGNFVLTNIRVKAGTANHLTEVPLAKAEASYSQRDWEISKALDPNKSSGWAVDGNSKGGPVRVAVFTFADPIEAGPGSLMQVQLDQDCPIKNHNIGRFRLSLTTIAKPSIAKSGLPDGIATALMLAPEKRSAAQERELAALYSSTLAELDPLRDELELLVQTRNEVSNAGVDPALTARKVLAHFIAAPGALDVAVLLDLARRWPHASLKSAVDGIVKVRLMTSDVTAGQFAQGLDALRRMELPMDDPNVLKARIRLLDGSAQKDFPQPEESLALLDVLEAGAVRAEDLSLLKRFSTDDDPAVRAKAGSLISTRHTGDAAAEAFCRDLASSDSAGLPQRLDALVTLTELAKTPVEDDWQKLLFSPKREIVLAALRGLQRGKARAAARRILENATERMRKQHGSAIRDDLAFATAVLDGRSVAGADKAELRGHVLADLPAGSPELGRLVFRMRGCYACHVTGDPKVPAPRLDQVAETHDAAYLVDSIIEPNKAVKTGFLTQQIVLPNGKIITGTFRRNVSGEGRYDEVINSTGQRTLYRSGLIESATAVSSMPAALEATMSRTELVDLVSYLQTLK